MSISSHADAQRLKADALAIFDRARDEGRPLTEHELTTANEYARQLKEYTVSRDLGIGSSVRIGGGASGDGPGDRFVNSKGWQNVADPTRRPQQWSSGPVDVGVLGKAGTVFESGQGAAFVATPTVVPGVVSKLFEPLGVNDLFANVTTDGPTVRYLLEGTATSGAAGVAEGGLKPASDLAYSTVDEPVKKIATVLTISDELLDDTPSLRAYVNGRLNLFVRAERERQLLRGGGTNELVGVFGRSGINTYTKLAADDNAVALARVLANTAGSANLAPDAIIMHPSNWLVTRLLRDGTGGTIGQFYGGGPFTGAYGTGGASTGLFGQSLWGVPVVLSTVVGAGTCLVGNFTQAAAVHNRGGVSVEVSNSHSDYFQKNLAMLRAESRQALAVYRPVAFTEVRGLA